VTCHSVHWYHHQSSSSCCHHVGHIRIYIISLPDVNVNVKYQVRMAYRMATKCHNVLLHLDLFIVKQEAMTSSRTGLQYFRLITLYYTN
jgi:hypothetical protein